MGAARKTSIYAVQLDTDAMGAPQVVSGVTQQNVNMGIATTTEPTDGELYPRHKSITERSAGASFTLLDIDDMLDISGVLGICITAAVQSGMQLFAYYHDECAGRQGTLKHRQYLIKKGYCFPERLTVEGNGDAQLQMRVLAATDGTNDAIIESDLVTLPTVAKPKVFALAKATVAGYALTGITSMEIDFGLNVVANMTDGELEPSFISLEGVQPVITWKGIDVEWLKAANIPRTGKAATHANTTFYLRKRADGSTFVADGTAEHIKFTAAGLATITDAIDGNSPGATETTLRLECAYDGTNVPIVPTTSSAIT